MIQRLKELRGLLGLNQGEFALKIGIKQGSLSDIERGKVGLSTTNVMLICRTFNVSEEWLRNGNGKPFNNNYEYRNDLSDLEKEILSKFSMLDDNDRKSIESIIDSLYLKTTRDQTNNPTDETSATSQDEEVESLISNIRIEAESTKKGKISSVSPEKNIDAV